MNNRKWSDDETRWLQDNHGRMDLLSLSHELGIPLEDVEKRLKQLKLTPVDGTARKIPATVKEAVRELSVARKEYEKAIDLFHKRRFEEAERHFEELLGRHPDEKELLDRARMYLAACKNGRKKAAATAEPDEAYHAAVYEKNRGNLEKALDLLRRSVGHRDGDGRVFYLAACCHALAGDPEQAVANLRKAIAADVQNRIQARLESDLSSLRGNPGFSELIAGA